MALVVFFRILVVVERDEVGSGGVFRRIRLAGGRIDACCGDGGRRAAVVSHPRWGIICGILGLGVDALCNWSVVVHSLQRQSLLGRERSSLWLWLG